MLNFKTGYRLGSPAVARWKGAGAVLPEPAWDGSTKFRPGTKPGFSVLRLGFDQYYPWSNANQWQDFMTTARWAELVAAGVSHIRIVVDPTVFLKTDVSEGSLAPLAARVQYAVDDTLAHGMKAIVDMHVNITPDGDQAYTDDALRAAFVAQSALWGKCLAVWARMGTLLNGYATAAVGFEIYNETKATDHAVYKPMLVALEAAFRSKNRRSTILFGPCNYAGALGFQASGFAASDFGGNSGFVHHMYDPHIFTHQSLVGGYQQYIHDLAFPRVSGGAAAAKAAAAAEINADGALTSGQKTALIAATDFNLDDFFTRYYSQNWYAGGVTYMFPLDGIYGDFGTYFDGGPLAPTDGYSDGVVDGWRKAHGVSRSDMHVTEFGSKGNYSTNGAELADRVAWMAMVTRYLDARGYNRTIWAEDDMHMSLRKFSGSVPTGALEPALLTAVGLQPPPVGARVGFGASGLSFTTTRTAPAIAGSQSGDVAIAIVSSAASNTITPPDAGWQLIKTTAVAGLPALYVYAKTLAAALGAQVWTWGASQNNNVSVAVYRGVILPDAADVVESKASTGVSITLGLTSALANTIWLIEGYRATGADVLAWSGADETLLTQTGNHANCIAQKGHSTPQSSSHVFTASTSGDRIMLAVGIKLEPA